MRPPPRLWSGAVQERGADSARPAGVLHTIFFHRALGAVRPIEKDCELFDVTFVQCNDAAVDQRIAGVASQYEAWAAGHPGKQGQARPWAPVRSG